MTQRRLLNGLFPSVIIVSTPGPKRDAVAELAMRPCPAGVRVLWIGEGIGERMQRTCQYCDGTGDVHSTAGEWRGFCSCEAGQALQKGGA